MLFRRRVRRGLLRRLADALWPPGGYRRAGRYVGYRLMRLQGSPHALAGGFAWGAAVSFMPFVGLHILVAWIGCLLTRGNAVAAVIGTAVGNPWTFPFIWAGSYLLGARLLGMDAAETRPVDSLNALAAGLGHLFKGWLGLLPAEATLTAGQSQSLLHLFWNVFLPMLVGGAPLAVAAWFLFYLPLRRLVARYQAARREKVLGKLLRLTGKEAGVPPPAVPERQASLEAPVRGKERSDGD